MPIVNVLLVVLFIFICLSPPPLKKFLYIIIEFILHDTKIKENSGWKMLNTHETIVSA